MVLRIQWFSLHVPLRGLRIFFHQGAQMNDWKLRLKCIKMKRCIKIIRSGVTLYLRTYVHPGRTCRFTYAVHGSGIPRKSRHGLTYFHFPVLIWQGNAIRSSRWIEYTFVVFFKTIRFIQGQHELLQSRFKTNESTALAKWRALLHFTWKYKQLAKR